MPTRVKICGITTWDDARLSIDLGASALGFNFYPPSPRAISPADAWSIIRRLPPFVEAVGVFVNWPPLVVDALARALRLGSVQLHGAESPGEVGELARKHRVIKAVQVKRGFRARFAGPVPRSRCNTAGRIRARIARRHRPHTGLEIGASRKPLWTDHPGGRPDAGKYCRGHSRRSAVRRGCGQRRRSAARPQGSRAIARAVRRSRGREMISACL